MYTAFPAAAAASVSIQAAADDRRSSDDPAANSIQMHIYECVPVHCCTIAWLELIMSKTTSQSKATRTRPVKLKDSDTLSRIQAICSTEILAFAKSFLSKAMPSSI